MPARTAPPSFWKRNALSLVFGALMLLSLVGHALTGWRVENHERREHGRPPEGLVEYVAGGNFLSTLFENWESEFLQMGLFVLLTAHLRQKGAAESRPFDPAEEETGKAPVPPAQQPWAARQEGLVRRVYEHSLSGALFLLFLLSFGGHLWNSWLQHAEEQAQHGEVPGTLMDHLASARFWFESMQNWQSEFLAVVSLVLLSIVLREKDSTESKDVEDPHAKTGA